MPFGNARHDHFLWVAPDNAVSNISATGPGTAETTSTDHGILFDGRISCRLLLLLWFELFGERGEENIILFLFLFYSSSSSSFVVIGVDIKYMLVIFLLLCFSYRCLRTTAKYIYLCDHCRVLSWYKITLKFVTIITRGKIFEIKVHFLKNCLSVVR